MSWKKLNETWTSKICSLNFRILDAGETDNFEYVLSNAFNKKIKISRIKRYIVKYLKTISSNTYGDLMRNYKNEYELKNISWDPDVFMKTVKNFILEIRRPYFSFQNDDTSLFLISRAFDFDLIILNNEIEDIVHVNTDVKKDKFLIIYKDKSIIENSTKQTIYSLIGFKTEDKRKKNMTIFTYNNLPLEVSKLTNKNKDLLYNEYIDKILSEKNECGLELNEVIKKLQKSKGGDCKDIIGFINESLNNKKYFSR